MVGFIFDGNKAYRFSRLCHTLTLFPCLFSVFGLAFNFVKSDKANTADFMHLTFLISQTHARSAFSIAEADATEIHFLEACHAIQCRPFQLRRGGGGGELKNSSYS